MMKWRGKRKIIKREKWYRNRDHLLQHSVQQQKSITSLAVVREFG